MSASMLVDVPQQFMKHSAKADGRRPLEASALKSSLSMLGEVSCFIRSFCTPRLGVIQTKTIDTTEGISSGQELAK